MNIRTDNPEVRLVMIEGVWHVLFPLSGWCAMQRGSQLIEPVDLVKAIYVADLEHVSRHWDDWQNYEKFVSDIPLSEGRKHRYINRTLELLTWHRAAYGAPDEFVRFPPPSTDVQRIVAAQELARARDGEDATPSSCDLLFCACSENAALSEALQQAGLQLGKLEVAVKKVS
jgi:hypothetical protein